MRIFVGRDILSHKDFKCHEFMRVFEVAEELEPIARLRRNTDLLKEKILVINPENIERALAGEMRTRVVP
jgi:aspartate carbamoyltransferase catalytic subunit